ncbi:hypothetical protein [Ornithinimicrobium sediminis]|uniref:hypothetical protein n=1 Tax=Ornithinimicrobium sediminis TaxID=2904603 RepID=UPI001E5CE8BC|nr:hypothetical protein [Ornithinimicrobium sediminis]MCE0487250.1 hypothetical protein [Ornithinimicrobium sediminis]
MRSHFLTSALAVAALALGQTAAASPVGSHVTDVAGQGPGGPVVSPEGASLQRNDSGLSVKLTMATPAPGTYTYPSESAFQPEGARPGHPEAFSLWVFVYNHPELCSDGVCDANDLGDTPAQGGAFNGGGHVVGGGELRLAGRVTVHDQPFVGEPVTRPRSAEVHLAVAPHGELQPDVLPDQISTPIGTPDHWWLAQFAGTP